MKRVIALLIACLSSTMLLANHWTPESAAYSDNMSLYGVIQINGEEQYSDQLEVGVFCGDECRGSAIVGEFWLTHRYLAIITIYGASGHQLTFKLYDHCLGEELELTSPTAITFNDDGYGTPVEPYVLNFTGELPPPVFHFATEGNWSEASNWCGNALPGAEDEVIIDANCTLDVDAEVTTLTVSEGQTLTLQSGKTLTVSGTLTNAAIGGLVIEDGGQLYHNNAGVMATVKKTITAYTANNNGWNFIASPMVSSIEPSIENGFLANEYDLYYYDEPYHYWRNHKVSNNSQHPDFDIEPQMGYLYANDEGTTLKFKGELQPSNDEVTIDNLSHEASTLTGFNLVGNPFVCNATIDLPAFVISGKSVVAYTEGTKTLVPCEGVMVQVDATNERVTVTKVNTTESAPQLDQLQIIVAQQTMSKGVEYDNAIINFKDGNRLEKFDFGTDAPKIYIPEDGKDYAIVTSEKTGELPLNFKAMRNGEYTISVNPEGADVDYLHLIDNLMGADVDLLQTPDYTFTAMTTDYASRFRLVFSVCKDADGDNAPFAFFANGTCTISNKGEASLQVVDLMGRILISETIKGSACKAINAAAGIYVLRLVSKDNVKTQKIVVR